MRNAYKTLLILVSLGILLVLAACGSPADDPGDETGNGNGIEPPANGAPAADAEAEADVRAVVEAFGKRLANVSLLAPDDEVRAQMEEQYGDLVTPDLLAAWQEDPQNAPGRLTSSPWPDRIEIVSVEQRSDTAYAVEGVIIEVTSTEQDSGDAAAKRPITLVVGKHGEQWLIEDVTLGEYEEGDAANDNATDDDPAGEQAAGGSSAGDILIDTNERYGFNFALPASWAGYKILEEEWTGRSLVAGADGDDSVTGPLVIIRHPQWTQAKPRQDIPILVFTHEQWQAVEREELSLGAAPIPPTELGSNEKYVFALPARYNYEFLEGYEEVEEILAGNPLLTK